ncbi:MAG: aminotransferase class I and II [Acidobacteria bacterium]|nr:aminotransferase class I and II [Acidobacteriota bacterium]
MQLRTVKVTRYVTPLREGGSLPAIVEADDDGLYVLKFRGSGQGKKALIAELLGGEIGRVLGLRVPEIVFAELDPVLAMTEPDPEIQELMKASAGLNLALDYLPGSIMYDPALKPPDAGLASRIVWFDAFIANVDRTARNANMLLWHNEIWLIDHGASLYFHHNWTTFAENARNPFPMVKDHILRPFAENVSDADKELSGRLSKQKLSDIISLIPDAWLDEPEAEKAAYLDFFMQRLASPRDFVTEAAK